MAAASCFFAGAPFGASRQARITATNRTNATIIMATTLVVSSDVAEDTGYKITKTLCENQDKLPSIHASMDVFNCATAIKTQPIPVHPGALKYYKEKGIS